MTDNFIEQLVTRKTTIDVVFKKIGLILVTVISALAMIVLPQLFQILMWVTVGLCVFDYFMFRRMNIEYEYSYFNGDLDIDKIMNKESRKKLFFVNVKEMEVIAPTGSDALRPFTQLKKLDFSSAMPGAKTYEMVTEFKGNKVRVVFEPNEEMLHAMRDLAPRKVFF